MQDQLRAAGAHFDDIRYCPHHPEGKVAAYARACDCRKPRAGMILDLMTSWPVVRDKSLVVGNQDSDMEAARGAGLRGIRYDGGNLDELLAAHLPRKA
jgi:D-glycero-D-manno-heptose 1,7-bisphosphate phosphatase